MQFRKWHIYVVLCVILLSIFVSQLIIAQQLSELPIPVAKSEMSSLANGEKTTVTIWWNKRAKGFTMDHLDLFVVDDNWDPIDLSNHPRIKMPFLDNFQKISRRKFKVDVTAPWHYGGRIVDGRLVVHVKPNVLKSGNAETNHPIDFGKKADCWLTPSRIYLANGKTMPIALFWDRNVSGVDLNDVRSYKGKLSNFRGNSSSQRVTFQAPRKGEGWLRIILRKNACAEGNNKKSISIRYGPPM